MRRPCRRPMKSRRSEPARSRFPTLPGTARASALGWEQAWATEWARVLVMEWASEQEWALEQEWAMCDHGSDFLLRDTMIFRILKMIYE